MTGENERYYVDERIGCIAVRDREQTDADYPGLHCDTRGVVRYWQGWTGAMPGKWFVAEKDREAARALCREMNAAEGEREGADERH